MRKPKDATPKKYSKKVTEIVAAAQKFAEEKRSQGWTRQDAAAKLKKMLESDTGSDE